jgi:glycosyltransferase involved in cell wall biosynthesis
LSATIWHTLNVVLATLSFVIRLVLSIEVFRGIRTIPVLEDVATHDLNNYPSLSVVVPARNEERAAEESIETMLGQEYPGDLEVIAINDRSADRTGEILEQLRSRHPNLHVFDIEELPQGWLGKNHALNLGAAKAKGEWLLFTDADVHFSGRCFEDAVRYAVQNDLHHLTLFPDIVSKAVLLKGFVLAYASIFLVALRPWRARDPRAKEHVGVGAFNLIQREVYMKAGTHRAIPMRPDDDVKLAKLVKKRGFRQGAAFGSGMLSVEWHQSLGSAVRGLSKTLFPWMGYRLDMLMLATLLLFLVNVFPFIETIFFAKKMGVARLISVLNVLLFFATYYYQVKYSKTNAPLPYAVLYPVSTLVFIYAMWRSAYTTITNDGIEWRGTKYPLESLKKDVV